MGASDGVTCGVVWLVAGLMPKLTYGDHGKARSPARSKHHAAVVVVMW